jgi:uncharacterized HAD superfamily protein
METLKATPKQIERAEKAFKKFLHFKSIHDFDIDRIGLENAQKFLKWHNDDVRDILNGEIEVERRWREFFLGVEIKKAQRIKENRAKARAIKKANKLGRLTNL